MENKWIAHEISRKESKVNMICIPYAGASANIYGKWKEICPVEYSILPVLFPKRETRYMEEMPEHVGQLAEMFVLEAKEIFEKPVLLFGHCTGATLAYEIALAAERILGKKVAGLIASSANEPEMVPEETKELMCASGEELIAYLRKEELVEDEMLADEDFCDYYLPVLQADFKMYGAYKMKKKKQLDCPIITIYDKNDAKLSEETVGAWAGYTLGEYRSYHVEGGHYYIDNPEQILQVLQTFLEEYLTEYLTSVGEKSNMKNLNDEEFYALGEMLFSNRCMQKEKQDKILEYSKEDVESYLNYGKRMAQFAVSQPEKIAIVDEQERITYKQLRERCMVLAAYFQSEGINKGDKAALQMENSGMFIIITLALFEIGAIPIMLLPAHQKREIEGVVKKAEPKVIITDRGSNEYQKMIQGIIDDSISVQKWYITEQLRNIQLENSMKLEAAEEIRQDDLVMLLLSGGTTGIPKLIPRTQGDYIYNNEALARGLQLNQDDIFLAVLPLAHNFPLGAPGIMGKLLVGGTVVVSKYPTPLEIFSLIEEEKVTYVSMVPTILNMCLQYRSFDDSDDLSSLKFIMVGGAVLPTELSRKVDDLFSCKLIQIYGTAEGLCCVNSLKDSWETRCTVQGKPCSPFDELKIIDEKGNEVAEGELVTKGPYTIKEYYRLEDKENQYFTEDGYYRTGDKVRIDEQGNVVVLGRAKEQINRVGEKIMPSEVEENLLMHDAIKECAVVGIKDETLGNRICAFVVTENQEITLSEARSFLTEKGMASFKLPDQLEIIAAMPYTAVKKIDKKKLAAMLEEN